MPSARPHILMAEDEALGALVLADHLEQQGFRVTVTANGQMALGAEAKDPADILLTDMRMPVMDGAELIRRIRRSRPNLPVVVTTGNAETIPPEEARRMVVVHKPFSLAVVAKIVQAVLMGAEADDIKKISQNIIVSV